MTDVFLEREFDPPLTPERLGEMVADTGGCLSLHRVDAVASFLSSDRCRMICHFRGPDAESVRNALRKARSDMTRCWPGTTHDAPGVAEDDIASANVVIQRRFDDPVELAAIQAIEDEGAWCLDAYNVKFLRTHFSADHRSMVCLYRAPDAEAVRSAQRQAKMPFDHIWAFTRV